MIESLLPISSLTALLTSQQSSLKSPLLRLREMFYPLGFPLRVSTNSTAVIEAARMEWDAWTQTFDEPPIVLNFEVSGETCELPSVSTFHAHDHQFALVADSRNAAAGDNKTRRAVAWLTASAVDDAAYFRHHFLEAMALEMIVSLYMTPFHAACVARNGRGVLLCGDSGAGKSSLSYACARRGWTYLSDDASYLLRRRAGDRLVFGHSHRLRLRPDAPRLFSELASVQPRLRGNGEMSLELRTATLPGIATARSTAVDRIVVLRRAAGQTRLTAVEQTAARALCEPIFYWWDREVSTDQQAAFDMLLDASEVFLLEYSSFDAAIDLLEA